MPQHTPHPVPVLQRRATRYGAALVTAVLLEALSACGSATPDSAHGPAHAPAGPGSTSAARRAAPAQGFTLAASGDLLVHDSIIRQAQADAGGTDYDFRPMLAGAKPVVAKADLAICHMETVYGPTGGPFTGYPLFVTPPQIARAVKDAGYRSCSTASNHTLDAGEAGVARTLDALDDAGLLHAGSARSEKERHTPTLLEAGDAHVAHLAYTYGTNGIPVPQDKPWLVNLLDPEQVIADARAARRAGADVVVVSTHWGSEWQEAPDDTQLTVAQQLTAAETDGRRDIDLVLGTHAHVPQAYEKVNGTWVVYGMGDQIAGVMNDPRGQMGSTARFTFAPPKRAGGPWQVTKAEFVPHITANDPLRVVALPQALEGNPGDPHYVQALGAISDAVLSRGGAENGLTMGR